MLWCRMGFVALRLAWPYPFAPWRSPLMRWRLETFGVADERGRLLHAEELTASHFVRFVLHHRRALTRFLRWAACL